MPPDPGDRAARDAEDKRSPRGKATGPRRRAAAAAIAISAPPGWRRSIRGRGTQDRDARLLQALDVAGDLPPLGDNQAPVADRAADTAAAVDDELEMGRQLAAELPVDLGDVDDRVAFERPGLRDLHALARHARLDLAFDNDELAVADLDALQLHVSSDDELRPAAGRRQRGRLRRGRGGGRRCTDRCGTRGRPGGRWIAGREGSADRRCRRRGGRGRGARARCRALAAAWIGRALVAIEVEHGTSSDGPIAGQEAPRAAMTMS